MFLLKIVTVIAMGMLTLAMVKFVAGALQAAKARVEPRQRGRTITRLRQDPRTGIYYPEE